MASTLTTELKDKRQKLIQDILADPLHGKKIYILGSSEFGPTNEPILVKSSVGLHTKFGTKGTLMDAFHAIKYTNRDNQIYVMKVTGEHATAYLNVNIDGGEIIEDGFTIVASQSNELYNDVEIIVDIDRLTFKFPKDLGLKPISYIYNDYHNISILAQKINHDTKNKKNCVYAHYSVDPATPVENAFFPVNPTTVYLYGGECGLNYSKNLLYYCLERAYEVLESHDIDIIIPVDAFLDDIYPDDNEGAPMQYNMTYYQKEKDYLTETFTGKKLSYMNQLINFCIKQLNFGVVTNGIIGFNSSYKYWSLFLSEADDIAKMYKACYEYNLAQCENKFYAFLVSAVAGDIMYNKGTIIDNGYFAYAALCASTKYLEGTSNVPISDTIRIWHEFSEDVLADLAGRGIVSYRHSPFYDKPVAYSGITCGGDNENLRLYCNVRMVQLAISYLNRLFQFYIGLDMVKLVKEKIVVNDIETILHTLKSRGIITSYEFRIVPYYSQGHIKVYLTMMTNYMVKAVHLATVIEMEFIDEMEEM